MKTKTKICLIIAASLVLIGCIIFVGVMSMFKWDFSKLSTVKYQSNYYEIDEEFESISIKTNTADIMFVLSDDKKCKVECYDEEKAKHTVSAQDGGALVIEQTNNKRWYDYIGINIGSPKITIYLPKTEYTDLFITGNTGDVKIPKEFTFKDANISLSTGDINFCASSSDLAKIKTNTGDIFAENISVASLELLASTGKVSAKNINCERDFTISISTGDVYLSDVNCKNLISNGKTSDISLDNVIAAEKFSIKTSTGDIRLDKCDAAELAVETKTGDIVGTLLTSKVFITEASTGKIDVPKTTTGGRCELKTKTGDIKIELIP